MSKGGEAEASPEAEHHEEPETHVEGDEGHDDNLHEMIGHEMMGAIHRKDHKALMHTVEAAVLNCLSKKGKE